MKLLVGSSLKIQQGNAYFQYLATFSATLTIITSGMHYGWPSPSIEQLLHGHANVKLSNDEGSWMAVMPLIGSIVGSLIVAATVDILGRKKTIIMCSFPFFAAWIMIAFATTAPLLYIARFIAGVADGWAFTAVPMYIGEIADPEIRGMLGSCVAVAWIFGILLINILGSYLSITVTALLSSVLPVISLVTFVFMPESPYLLLMRKNPAKARTSLQTFRGIQDVETELQRLSNAVKLNTENTGKFVDLFTVPSNRKAIGVACLLRAAQQFSGTTAITFYTKMIFKEVGDTISSEIATIIYCSVQLFCSMFCSSIVDKAGRRPLLILSISGTAIALFCEGTYFYLLNLSSIDVSNLSYIPIVALIGFVVVFGMGMQTIPIMMLGELFPSNVKASALCIMDIYFCIIASLVSKFFQFMKDTFGIYVPFYAFGCSCIVSLVCIIFFVPETKGKTLEDIQAYLEGKLENNNSNVTEESFDK